MSSAKVSTSGLVIKNRVVPVSGVEIVDFLDVPGLALAPEDGQKRRTRWVRMQILHTTKGIPHHRNRTPQRVRPGAGPRDGRDRALASYWQRDPRSSAAHGVIDVDGSVAQLADLVLDKTFHAGNRGVNEFSIGWEMFQEGDGSLWESTLDAQVALVIAVGRAFGIQFQIHHPYTGATVPRLVDGGADCVGVFGHRDVTSNRGHSDPGDMIFDRLMDAGFEAFDFSAGEDREVWKERQEQLGLVTDGIPGPQTVARLREAGYRGSIWVLGKQCNDDDGKPEDGPMETRVCEFPCPLRSLAQLLV
ncbi:MAG: N-acetylmuramoyl-L-alanine amidase [Proteobacteria bacterium]|nr:N-acetylmuramoyl-L-alanine amidase [Pseudomonadota bacterium]